jgi:hypothetical protein
MLFPRGKPWRGVEYEKMIGTDGKQASVGDVEISWWA